MIHLALRDLRHDLLNSGFNLLGNGVLIFAFLLLISLSITLTTFGVQTDLARNLVILRGDSISPEQSSIPPAMANEVAGILGSRLNRIDPVIFRIMRVEESTIQLRGVAFESWNPTFRLNLLEGEWPANPDEIVVERLLAEGAGWGVGHKIKIYGHSFSISGVVEGRGTSTLTVWIDYASAENLFGPGKGSQFLVANLNPGADPIEAKTELENSLQMTDDFDVYFEESIIREFGLALNDLGALTVLLTVIAIVAVTLGSHNMAWLAADERRQRLGILRALGFNRQALSQYLLIRALLITAVSYALAFLAADLYIQGGMGAPVLEMGGVQLTMVLDPLIAVLGFALACGSTLIGTWLSIRSVLIAPAASLLGRGPGALLA